MTATPAPSEDDALAFSSAARSGWREWAWQQFVVTANPRTTHSEDLSPAELSKQASFESFDYYKPYPAIYLKYLREKPYRSASAARAQHPERATLHAEDGEAELTAAGKLARPLESPAPEATDAYSATALAGSAVAGLAVYAPQLPEDEEERHTPLRWFLHVLIALSVGVVATVVSYAVEILETYRADTLSRIIHGAPFRLFGYVVGFFFWVLFSVALVAIATGVVVYLVPAAAGGGIPDVMAYLNGVHMRDAMNIKTFAAKAVSCVCAVAGGLPVGLEAPLIHLGAITGAGVTQGRSRTLGFQTPLFQAFRNNKDRRDFITAGAACGVSAAFGAPIGGLLFVMEEVSSFWDHSSSGQIFLATMIAFTITTIINSLVEDNRMLGWVSNAASVLFEVNITIPLNLVSIVPSLVLGAILGCLAALFTKANLVMIKWRRRALRPYPLRRFLEPVVVSTVYCVLMYTLTLLSDCRSGKEIRDVNGTIHVWGTEGNGRLFNDTCHVPGEYTPLGTLNMATGKNTIRHLFTRQTVGEFPIYYLAIHFILYFVFACVSSGMALSGGLVVPSLVIGAIFGRLYGLLLWYMTATHNLDGVERGYGVTEAWADPGVFALIGAGAFLAGTSRMAMSICVIMVELSSELHYLLPVMVAIVMSKTVADWISEPLYHQMLHFDCVPYLRANLLLPQFQQLTAADVMASPVVVLRRHERTEEVLRVLRETSHNAFPVVAEVANEEHSPSSTRAAGGSCGPRESVEAADGFNSPSRVRGLDTSSLSFREGRDGSTLPRHLKFAGLVTREDLQVYLTLPQLRNYDPATAPAGDALAQCVLDINRMSWQQWQLHKTSLFLSTGDRQEWVRHHQPLVHSIGAGRQDAHSSGTEAADVVEKALSPEDGTAASMEDVAAVPVVDDGARPRDVGYGAVLPPVLDLTIIVNRSPWVVTPSFSLQAAYETFRTMGLRHMVVIDGDVVRGIITRKDLLVDSLRRRMKELRARLVVAEAARGGGSADGPTAGSSRGDTNDTLQRLFTPSASLPRTNGALPAAFVRGPGTARASRRASSRPQDSAPPVSLLWEDS